MLPILLAMLVVLVLVGLVLAYVTWPHRGEEMPFAPRVGDALWRTREAIPTLEQPSDAYVEDSSGSTPGGAHRA